MFKEFLPCVRHHAYDHSTRAHPSKPPSIDHKGHLHMISNLALSFQACSPPSDAQPESCTNTNLDVGHSHFPPCSFLDLVLILTSRLLCQQPLNACLLVCSSQRPDPDTVPFSKTVLIICAYVFVGSVGRTWDSLPW